MDDDAGADQWVIAADKITQPSNVQIMASSNVMQTSMTSALAPGQKPTLRGESLRTKTTPTVSALFAQRLPAMPDVRHACALAEAFAAWDVKAALAHITTFVKASIAGYAASSEKSTSGSCIAALTNSRVDAGDASALSDYGAWLAKTSPKDAEYDLERWFQPMIAHTGSAPIVAAANVLFAPPSPWVPFISESAGYMTERILDLDLYKLDAFKRHIASKLADKKAIGTITIRATDTVEVKTAGFTSTRGTVAHDPLTPPDGTTMSLRTCDEYAAVISAAEVAHAPTFRINWRQADRDAALLQMTNWLRTR